MGLSLFASLRGGPEGADEAILSSVRFPADDPLGSDDRAVRRVRRQIEPIPRPHPDLSPLPRAARRGLPRHPERDLSLRDDEHLGVRMLMHRVDRPRPIAPPLRGEALVGKYCG